MTTIVYYHDHCTDGYGAAFVVYKLLGTDEVEYIPCSYNTEPPLVAQYKDNNVIIVDFSFPLDVMQSIFDNATHTTWLDHHKTAFEMFGKDINTGYTAQTDKLDIVLDNNRSGALLSYEHFFGPVDAPVMIRHIDDRDRWVFAMSGSRRFHAALHVIKPWSFKQWDELDEQFNSDVKSYNAFIELGDLLLKNERRQIESAAKRPRACNVICYSGLAVNSTVHMSEIGHELANASDTFGLIYYIDADNSVKCSLRSNGDYDVSIIAKYFGGGGHKNAAGFTTDLQTLQRFLT